VAQLLTHPRPSVGTAALRVDRADVHFQLLIFELPFAGLSADVGVAR